jgi:hypothetical protein
LTSWRACSLVSATWAKVTMRHFRRLRRLHSHRREPTNRRFSSSRMLSDVPDQHCPRRLPGQRVPVGYLSWGGLVGFPPEEFGGPLLPPLNGKELLQAGTPRQPNKVEPLWNIRASHLPTRGPCLYEQLHEFGSQWAGQRNAAYQYSTLVQTSSARALEPPNASRNQTKALATIFLVMMVSRISLAIHIYCGCPFVPKVIPSAAIPSVALPDQHCPRRLSGQRVPVGNLSWGGLVGFPPEEFGGPLLPPLNGKELLQAGTPRQPFKVEPLCNIRPTHNAFLHDIGDEQLHDKASQYPQHRYSILYL